MGIQTMGSQGGGDSNGKRSQLQPLTRQNSMYGLTLDEVHNQLGDLGRPLSSLNLDELLKSVWTVETSQSLEMDNEGTAQANQAAPQRQGSLSLSGALSKKTVHEVWRDIQQNKDSEKKPRDRQPTLGEMTLEDFLVKAGVVADAPSNKKNDGTTAGIDPNVVVPQFPPQGQWIPYPQPQYQHPQQSLMGIYVPSQGIAQSLHMGGCASLDVSYADNQVALPPPLMGTVSDTQTPGRKRSAPEDMVEKTVERRQKRMIKNRESAARSRARKQAYTNELENKVSRLEEENERLRKRKELEQMLPCTPPPEPKYQLRRIASAPL
ncbi:ABSCISIC ACID-INSENSITIVE 5-like protein 2 [Lotus japonicus]|uniref:ABSCISIC ACID-INSENSITIVE 5-like protein 2 n=1 Tax=Lotus japonicus TaxID=34305 RepID=UPI002589C9FD|nr:ABSCISIC ACID-INSENSITIVE 5-like protein 2 [Lotus japonicus]